MGRRKRNDDLLANLVKGAHAGAVATWAMGPVTSYFYQHESKQARKEEDEARGNSTAYEVAAETAVGVVGRLVQNHAAI